MAYNLSFHQCSTKRDFATASKQLNKFSSGLWQITLISLVYICQAYFLVYIVILYARSLMRTRVALMKTRVALMRTGQLNISKPFQIFIELNHRYTDIEKACPTMQQ